MECRNMLILNIIINIISYYLVKVLNFFNFLVWDFFLVLVVMMLICGIFFILFKYVLICKKEYLLSLGYIIKFFFFFNIIFC